MTASTAGVALPMLDPRCGKVTSLSRQRKVLKQGPCKAQMAMYRPQVVQDNIVRLFNVRIKRVVARVALHLLSPKKGSSLSQ